MTDNKELNELDDLEPNDEASVDYDDLEEFDDEDFGDENPTKKKSSSKSLLFFLLLVLLGIGGAGYFFLGKSLPVIGEQASSAKTLSIPPVPNAVEQGNNMAAALPPPPMPTPIGPDVGLDGVASGEITPVPPIKSVDVIPVAPTVNDIEDMGNTDIVDNAIVVETPSVEEDIQPSPSVEEPSEIKETISDVTETLAEAPEAIKKSVEETTKDLEELVTEEELEPAVLVKQVSTETDQRIIALEKNIQTLVDRINTMPAETETALTPATNDTNQEKVDILSQQMLQVTHRLDQLSKKIEDMGKQQSKPAPVAAPAKKITKAQAPKKVITSVKKKTPVSQKTSWTLRSAQPGVAWLSKSGTSEMQRYGVGQKIPGFGTIKSVTQQNGKWVVQTNNGTIKQ